MNNIRNSAPTKEQHVKKIPIYHPETYVPKQNINVFDEVSFSTKIEQPKEQKFIINRPFSHEPQKMFPA